MDDSPEPIVAGQPLAALRVALVSLNADPFAPERGLPDAQQRAYVRGLAAALTERTQSLSVHTVVEPRRSPPPPAASVQDLGPVPPEDTHYVELLRWAKEVSVALLETWSVDRPDVVYAHAWMSGVAAQMAARELELPVVQTCYGVATNVRASAVQERRNHLQLALAVARAGHAVIVLSNTDLDALVRLGVPRTRLRLVPPGISSPQSPTYPNQASPTECLRLLGFAATEDAASVEDLHWLSRRLEASGVRLTIRTDVGEAIDSVAEADVVVALGEAEQPATVALHAMAAGRPVLGGAGGPVSDLVVDGVTGWLVSGHDRGRLLRTALRFHEDPCSSEAFGLAAYDRAATRYPWSRIAGESLAVLAHAAAWAG